MGEEQNRSNTIENNQCFVIMPISDPEGYEKGHFRYVYEDIFKPAIEEAGFEPKRADDDGSSSMIQVNIIKDIIESPMAICDLSTRNPNVLFELGIRQAFDLPVVLVQEEGTPRIFDINTINTIDYRSSLKYREVMEDRGNISKAIKDTKDNTTGVNSIIRLLEIGKAELDGNEKRTELDDIKLLLFSLSNQVKDLRKQGNVIGDPAIINTILRNDDFQKYEGEFNYLRHAIKKTDSSDAIHKMKNNIEDRYKEIMNDKMLSTQQKSALKSEYYDLMNRFNVKLFEFDVDKNDE